MEVKWERRWPSQWPLSMEPLPGAQPTEWPRCQRLIRTAPLNPRTRQPMRLFSIFWDERCVKRTASICPPLCFLFPVRQQRKHLKKTSEKWSIDRTIAHPFLPTRLRVTRCKTKNKHRSKAKSNAGICCRRKNMLDTVSLWSNYSASVRV